MQLDKVALPRSPRLPIKESLSNLLEKLNRLNEKTNNFRNHLWPQPQPANPSLGLEAPTPSDLSELIEYLHSSIDQLEASYDSIRDRF